MLIHFLSNMSLWPRTLIFPSDKWTIMLQTVLTGKAAEVFLSLTSDQQKDYQTVKDVILRSYAMVPEQYRKSFRELKRQQGQTYVEFVREKERYLERWIKS